MNKKIIFTLGILFIFSSLFSIVNADDSREELEVIVNDVVNGVSKIEFYNKTNYDYLMDKYKDWEGINEEYSDLIEKYEKRKSIPENKRENYIQYLKGEIKIYKGPFSNGEPIFKKTFKDVNYIDFKVGNNVGLYTVVIEPDSDSFKWYKDQTNFVGFQSDVDFGNEIKDIIKSNDGVTIVLKNTTLRDGELNLEAIEPQNKKENTVKSFNVVALKDVENLDLKIDYLKNEDVETSLFNYNDELKKWVKVDFKQDNNSISVLNADVGIYSIIEVPIKTEEIKETVDLVDDKSDVDEVVEINKNNTQKDNSKNNLIMFGGILILVVVIFFGYLGTKKKKSIENENIESIEQKNVSNVISRDEIIYNSAKEYVQKYKSNFSKDQLYRGLKKANTPIEIINRVLDEEY